MCEGLSERQITRIRALAPERSFLRTDGGPRRAAGVNPGGPGQSGAYDILSYGADGKEGGEGANKDISSAQ